MRTELLKERSMNQQLKQHIEMVDQNLQKWQENNNNNTDISTIKDTNTNTVNDNNKNTAYNNTELVKEKLQKMVSRSVSKRNINLSKDNLMKSLGWFAPAKSS